MEVLVDTDGIENDDDGSGDGWMVVALDTWVLD